MKATVTIATRSQEDDKGVAAATPQNAITKAVDESPREAVCIRLSQGRKDVGRQDGHGIEVAIGLLAATTTV